MSGPPARPGPRGSIDTGALADADWRDLVGHVGAEVAVPLTDALDRIQSMMSSGRIGSAELAALRAAVDEARRVGMVAQQLARFAARRIRVAHEPTALTTMLREVLVQRSAEADAHGTALCEGRTMRPAEVLADPSLQFGLLNALVDWALRHARSEVRFDVSMPAWPAQARLSCDFAYGAADERDERFVPAESLDSLAWRLVQQIAHAMDLVIERRTVDDHRVVLTLQFPRTANEDMDGVSSIDLSDASGFAPSSMPLVGSHVLVVASRRELRLAVRDAIHHMGLVIDLVGSVQGAIDFCRDGLPHAIIVEGILQGEQLSGFRQAVRAEVPDFPFIEIVEEGDGHAMAETSPDQVARVGRAALDTALSSVLLYELSKRV